MIQSDLHRVLPGPTRPGSGRRTMTVAAAVAAALGVFIAPGVLAADANSAELQSLKDQVQQMQRQIDRLQAQEAAAPSTAAPAAAPAAASSGAPAVKAGPLTLTFGGFMAFESVYRDHNEVADIGSNYNSAIPYPYQVNDHVSEFRASARQSRLSLLVQGPKYGSLSGEGYYETDFLSAGVSSNSAESNSYTLRMRNFYGVLKDTDAGWYLLAGQNWSLATLYPTAQLAPRSERAPQTIDAQYVAGFNWTRNAQLRFVKTFDKVASFGISIESPQASIYGGCSGAAFCGSVNALTTNTGGSLLNSTANYSLDFAPDIIVKGAIDPGYGHYEVYGLARGFRDRSPNTTTGTNNTTWAGSIGGGAILPLGSQLEFQASGLVGSGNGRYGSAQLPDATLRPDGTVAAVQEWQALLGLLYKPMPTLTIYVYGGEEEASKAAYTNAAGTVGYGYGNPLYSNAGCNSLTGTAATCIANTKSISQIAVGEWWKVFQGDIGNFQIGVQYSHTKRKAFAGVGGDPSTDINMGFVSFRWYPYQK